MAHSRAAQRIHVKVSTLQNDVFRAIRNLSVSTAHNSRQTNHALAVSNDDVVSRQLIFLAIEQTNFLAVTSHPRPECRPAQFVIIISMRRLRRHQHHVICSVNNVINRLAAHRHQLALQPQLTRLHSNITDCYRHEPRH